MTQQALSEIGYDGIFAFKYSRRPRTKALELPEHIDEDVRAERLSRALKLQEGITYRKNRLLEGQTLEVLVEGFSETDPAKLTGRTRTNKIVNFHGDRSLIGTFVMVNIREGRLHSLFGELV